MISIVIPAYNAEGMIATTLEDYLIHFSKEYPQGFEIIVVPNGCTDRTTEIVDDYCDKFPQVRSESFEEKLGKGGALIKGLGMACGDIVAFVDADGATTPKELHKLIKGIEGVDGVIGSRWLPGSNILAKQPLMRRIASRGFNLLVRLLFGLPYKDTQCGAKVFKRYAIAQTIDDLETPGFAFDVDLLYKAKKKGFVIKEAPIVWEDKLDSTLDLKTAIPNMFLALIKLRLSNSPFKYAAKHRGRR